MTASPRAWLPGSAFDLERTRHAFAKPLAAWSEDWFGQGFATIASVGQGDLPAAVPPIVLLGDGETVAVSLSPRGKRRLFEAACAVDLAEHTLGEAEHALIGAMTEEIVLDLLSRMNPEEGASPASRDPCLALAIHLSGREALTIHMAQSLLATKVRAGAAKSAVRSPKMVTRERAISSTIIPIEAVLGHGALALADLNTLAPGDIVLLDRALSDGVELKVAGQDVVVACGRPGSDSSKPAIYL